MKAQEWDEEIEEALREQGKEYTSDLRRFMYSAPDPATKDNDKYVAVEVTNAMQRLFWRRVVRGESFGDPNRVVERFDCSLEENYGLDSGPFLNLAKAYWTYQIELGDLFPDYHGTWLADALQAVEIKIRELFFPTPGPIMIPTEVRRQAQRECLEQFAPDLDIDRVLSESPVLDSSERRGCRSVTVIAVLGLGTAIVAGGVYWL